MTSKNYLTFLTPPPTTSQNCLKMFKMDVTSSALSSSMTSTLSSSSMAHFLLTCLRTFAFRDGQLLSYKKTANSHWGIKLWSGFCFQRPGKRSFGFVSLKFGTTGPSHDVRLMFCDKKDYFFMSQKYTKPPGGIIHRGVILFETEHECYDTSNQFEKSKSGCI